MTFSSGPADDKNISGTEDSLKFRDCDSPFYNIFQSSNAQHPLVEGSDSCIATVTGPLISNTATSWTFQGGTFHRSAGSGADYIPGPPPGYATCEEAGFHSLSNWCYFNGQLDGVIIGDVTLGLSDILGYGYDPFGYYSTVRAFQLTGSLLFDVNSDLARASGVASGPYLGWFIVDGTYYHTPTGDPGFLDEPISPDVWHNIYVNSLEVTGASVPETSSIVLLLTVCGAIGLGFRHRKRRCG
jgi:hypothetical protein